MNASHSKSDPLAYRLRRRRREIIFAIVLTLAAVAYLTSSQVDRSLEKAPVAMQGPAATLE